MAGYQVGVIAVARHGRGRVVLVTTRGGSRWIFPKGHREKGRSDPAIALEEAYEEAGLLGEVGKRYRVVRFDGGQKLRLYHMRVRKVLPRWPEMRERDRAIVSVKRAARLLPRELTPCLRWVR